MVVECLLLPTTHYPLPTTYPPFPKDDDGIDTSASDSDDENDDEVNDGSSVNVPPPASESR